MNNNIEHTSELSSREINRLVKQLIPASELSPASIDDVVKLPSFFQKMQTIERHLCTPYSELGYDIQEALVLRRLQQMTNTALLNPLWKELICHKGLTTAPQTMEEWQQIPVSDKSVQRDLFMGARPGMVVPIYYGGFEIVASGGTGGGMPVETVYSLRELQDTYCIAGNFMGRYQLSRYLTGNDEPKWVMTTLADYQMWSSGTMVGGVLQSIPGINYIGAGPVSKEVFQHILSYPGSKAFMGITAGIAILAEFAVDIPRPARESFRVALYGSGMLAQRKQLELKKLYPNLSILSYFAATQAETIGLQLDEQSPQLSTVPGLHLIEVVDEEGRWVKEGDEGELVVTRLHAHEAPFLRFKLGDRVIRRPRMNGAGLNAEQFEFSGRSGDMLHLNDTQYAAPQAYAALCNELKRCYAFDLDLLAYDIQFVNHRKNKLLTLLVAVDDPHGLTTHMHYVLALGGLHRLFVQALLGALSLFNQGEANPAAIEKTGYRFDLRLVHRGSSEIIHTSVGKVPLLQDIF